MPIEETNSLGIKMALIPPGEFLMGSPEESGKDFIVKKAPGIGCGSRSPFTLGRYQVTLGEFQTFYHNAKYKLGMERDPDAAVYGYLPPWKPGFETGRAIRSSS